MSNDLDIKGHEGRDDLAGEYKYGDAGQIVLLILFLVVWIADSLIFEYSTQLSTFINPYIRIAFPYPLRRDDTL